MQREQPTTARLVRASATYALTGGSRRPTLSLAISVVVPVLVLLSVPRFDYWGDQRFWVVLWLVTWPAFWFGRAAHVLHWPGRVTLFSIVVGLIEGALSVVGIVWFSAYFGAEPGHSLAEGIIARVPKPAPIPIDQGVVLTILVVIAFTLILFGWRRAKETNRTERDRIAAWATERGLPADMSA